MVLVMGCDDMPQIFASFKRRADWAGPACGLDKIAYVLAPALATVAFAVCMWAIFLPTNLAHFFAAVLFAVVLILIRGKWELLLIIALLLLGQVFDGKPAQVHTPPSTQQALGHVLEGHAGQIP